MKRMRITDYTVSVRVYDENDDWEGREWKLTKKQAIAMENHLSKKFGPGTDI